MGNAPYSTCGSNIARHLHGDDSRAEIYAADNALVFLNVYDLNEDWLHANNLFRDVLKIGGAFHTGVEVYGNEWSYGQEGVSSTNPRRHEVHIYRQSVTMGMTHKSPGEVMQLIQYDVMPRWQGSEYDILRRNCCSFADFLCGRLVRKHIPGWVNRFPKVASAASRGLGKVMDFGGSVSTAASNDASHLGRSVSAISGQSEASVTTVASPASTSRTSSEAGTPRSPRGWPDVEPDTSRDEVEAAPSRRCPRAPQRRL
mmetsp:Transcript_57342/g.158717  ORF Transcript_57342/g.158717 Transcript_57342/m.158717 type:complete len:257 (+) Transcript_57342:165-935(+)